MKHLVNDLLQISRIPHRFYAMVSGDDHPRRNPGTALKSFLVAKCLDHEMVDLKQPQVEYLAECLRYNTEVRILQKIVDSLITSASQLVNQINSLEVKQRTSLFNDVHELHLRGSSVKMAFDTLITSSVPPNNEDVGDLRVELDNPKGITFKNSIFELQDKISEIAEQVSRFITPEKEPA